MQDTLLRKTSWTDISDLEEFYQSTTEFTNVQAAPDSGIEHDACKSCWLDENNYGSSMRTNNLYYNNTPVSKGIRHVDLRLSNKCNLQCKMCNPHDSDQLVNLALELETAGIDNPLLYMLPDNNYIDNRPLLDLVTKLPNLETIRFAGGEPFMMPDVEEFLRKLIKLNKHHVSIEFITNCTTIKLSMMILLKQFKTVTVICSIDGVDETIEYQRYPSKWSVIERNFKVLYNSGFKLVISPCIGILNYLTIDKLFNWANQFESVPISYNEIYDPTFFNFRYIPTDTRKEFYDRFSNVTLENADPKWKQFQDNVMYETLEPTQNDCNMLYQYSVNVWDRRGPFKFLDLHPWANYMIAKAEK